MGIPQIIWIVLAASTLTISIVKAGESRGVYNPIATIVSLLLELCIVYAGGFFSR